MNTGWECPRCHRTYAPHVSSCESCRMDAALAAIPAMQPGRWAESVPCVHTWSDDSGPTRCYKCGKLADQAFRTRIE